ncbi:Sodium channel protein Nach, partial [Trachymyrmex cornetzi]
AKITDRSVDEILNLIMQLGNLYVSMMVIDNSNDVELDKLLTSYYNGSYDVAQIMKTLTPQCSTMLLKCILHGINRNCSELFEFRKTQDGYCCTFNYVRESDDIPDEPNSMIKLTRDQERVETLGMKHGLSVLMDPLLDDNFYSILPVQGWKVIVFNPTDYPDMTSGGVTEVLALPEYETNLNMDATLFSSSQTTINLPRNKRKCIFSDEIVFSNITMYTYSDCIVDCKINDIQKFCGCRPFIYPRRGKKECYPNYNITIEAVLNVYFSKYGSIHLIQDVSSYWYNLLSDIGGLCGIFIGFSFITVVELLYFFVLLFGDLFCKKSALQKDDRKTKIPPDQTQTTEELYWNELLPRSWHSAKYGKFSTKKTRY